MPFSINVVQYPQLQIVEILSSERTYDVSAIPEVLGLADTADLQNKPVVISHRGAVWLNAALVAHFKNVAPWVGTYDPNLGAVVVFSKTPEVQAGDIFRLPVEA